MMTDSTDRSDIMTRKEPGIRRKRGGWQAYVTIDGRLVTKMFQIDERRSVIRQWRADQLALAQPAARGSLRADVDQYCSRVAAMPTIAGVRRDLLFWVNALGGDRARQSVSVADIESTMQTWLTTPTTPDRRVMKRGGRPSAPTGLAPGTVLKRLSILRAFYFRMNGSKLHSPAAAAVAPKIPKPADRAIDRLAVDRILDALASTAYRTGAASRAAICARVIATTGLPPSTLRAFKVGDIDCDQRRFIASARKKGGGVEARVLPMLADAVDAFRAFVDADIFGRVPQSSVINTAFKRAAKRAGIDPRSVHQYDLRHSFLTDVYDATRDLATVGRLGLHAPGSKHTARYAMGANAAVDAAAVDKVAAAWQQRRQLPDGQAVAGRRPVKASKPRKARRLPADLARVAEGASNQ